MTKQFQPTNIKKMFIILNEYSEHYLYIGYELLKMHLKKSKKVNSEFKNLFFFISKTYKELNDSFFTNQGCFDLAILFFE